MIFERPDLDLAEKFLLDFGLRVSRKAADRLLMRGTDAAPFCYVALRGSKARFVGLGFTVSSLEDLNKLAAFPECVGRRGYRLARRRQARPDDGPGRPSRRRALRARRRRSLCHIAPPSSSTNRINRSASIDAAAARAARSRQARPCRGRSPNFQDVSAWYAQHFGFIPSDICVLPDGSPGVCFFRLDLGDTPADHHTLALSIHFMADSATAPMKSSMPTLSAWASESCRSGLAPCVGYRPPYSGQPDLRLLGRSLGRQARALLRRRRLHRRCPAEIHALSREAMAQWGPPMPKRFTRPEFSVASLDGARPQSLRAREDLTFKKLLTLLKLVG